MVQGERPKRAMQLTLPVICALATFVLVTDHLRTVAADEVSGLRVKRQDKYTTDFDNLDVDRILASERLIKSYIRCLRNTGPCTKEGRTLREYLPDALQTDCSKCSEVQKKQGGKVLTFVLQNYRQDWDALVDLYDPTGIFREKYGYNEEDNEDEEGDEAKRK